MSALIPYARQRDPAHSGWFFGDLVTVLAASADTDGRFALVETVHRPGGDPPRHMHAREDEAFYVADGEFTIFVGTASYRAPKGAFVLLPRGIPHGLHLESDTGILLSLIMPAGFEHFFEELSQPATDLATPPVGPPPDVSRMVALGQEYGITFPDHPAPHPAG
jgi:quercetin dioxygenase-like cupin family protein